MENTLGFNGRTIKLLLLLSCALVALPVQAAVVDFQRTVVVSPPGPTATDNGMALLMALNGIVVGLPAPSVSDRYLLKLEPGIYDVGLTPVRLPSWVHMEGSGEGVTLLRGNPVDAFSAGNGTVTVEENAGIRHLSAENYDAADNDTAAVVLLPGSEAHHITARSTGGSDINRALLTGFGAGTTVARASNITAIANTRAVQLLFPGLEVENIVATGTQGLLVSSGNMFVRNSRFTGSEFSMLVANLSETIDIVTTQLAGETSCLTEVCRCFASYDADLKELRSDCTPKKKGKKK